MSNVVAVVGDDISSGGDVGQTKTIDVGVQTAAAAALAVRVAAEAKLAAAEAKEHVRVVQAALDELLAARRRTTLLIAHRLSTIRNADTIAVVNEGAVIEQGTHDELLANTEGLYFNLTLAQSS
ncbi:MAG: hypothetical protein VX017_11090, partial [Pseudomonadota bacterium]|nr:hypothetical protein [Pseudomonadota bacterium]